MSRAVGWIALVAFITTVIAANLLVTHFGAIDVGFGLRAPAAVLVVGVAFTLRDVVHTALGRSWVLAAIVAGAALSTGIAPSFALASGVSFLVSEVVDFAVFVPLAERNWIGAVLVSNAAGLLLDSWLFLTLAFGSLELFWGQVVGKALMTVVAVALLATWQRPRGVLARHA